MCLTRAQLAQKGIVTEFELSDVVAAQETGFVKHYCPTARHLSPNVVEHVFGTAVGVDVDVAWPEPSVSPITEINIIEMPSI